MEVSRVPAMCKDDQTPESLHAHLAQLNTLLAGREHAGHAAPCVTNFSLLFFLPRLSDELCLPWTPSWTEITTTTKKAVTPLQDLPPTTES